MVGCQCRCREHAEAQRLAEATKTDHESRTAKLEERCSALAARNQQLEFRRALDVEGFAADIGLLRKQQAATARCVSKTSTFWVHDVCVKRRRLAADVDLLYKQRNAAFRCY